MRDFSIALTSVILTSVVGYITFSKQYNSDEKFRLNENINKLLDIELQYPFLEDSTFISKWERNRNSNNDSALRYLTYCEYVFNTLQNVCDYYNYDLEKIDEFMDVNDLIIMHRAYWENPELQKTESPEFRAFVNRVYTRLKSN